MGDRQFLLTLRIILVTFTAGALLFALNSKSTMYEMVQNAYNVTLAGAFVPLLAGAYWKKANTQGALASIVFGIGAWLTASNVGSGVVPANLVGLFASALGMLLGSLAPTILASKGHSIEASLHQAHQHRSGHPAAGGHGAHHGGHREGHHGGGGQARH
jgi:SSS family solute:Na+ symporter